MAAARPTFTSQGGVPGPFRAVLVEEARRHVGAPKVRYALMSNHDHDRVDWFDWRNISIRASSVAEAVVAMCDLANRSVPSTGGVGYDHFYEVVQPGENESEALERAVASLRDNYFGRDGDIWLVEWPETPRELSVPELAVVQTKSGGKS